MQKYSNIRVCDSAITSTTRLWNTWPTASPLPFHASSAPLDSSSDHCLICLGDCTCCLHPVPVWSHMCPVLNVSSVIILMGDQAVGTSREGPHLFLPTEAGTEGHGRRCGGTPVASPRSSCLPGAHPHGLLLQDQKVFALAGGKQAGPLHAPGTEREPDHGGGEVLAPGVLIRDLYEEQSGWARQMWLQPLERAAALLRPLLVHSLCRSQRSPGFCSDYLLLHSNCLLLKHRTMNRQRGS